MAASYVEQHWIPDDPTELVVTNWTIKLKAINGFPSVNQHPITFGLPSDGFDLTGVGFGYLTTYQLQDFRLPPEQPNLLAVPNPPNTDGQGTELTGVYGLVLSDTVYGQYRGFNAITGINWANGFGLLTAPGDEIWIQIRNVKNPPAGTYPKERFILSSLQISDQEANFSAEDIVILPAASPPEVTTLAATEVSYSTATLNGTVDANGVSSVPDFEWGYESDLADGVVVAATPDPVTGSTATAVSAALTGLPYETEVFFRVHAESLDGEDTGSILSFTTLPAEVGELAGARSSFPALAGEVTSRALLDARLTASPYLLGEVSSP